MTLAQARKLQPGDPVIAYNGPYTQHAKVVDKTFREQGGFWITYEWTDSNGTVKRMTKRHISVYLPDDNVQE